MKERALGAHPSLLEVGNYANHVSFSNSGCVVYASYPIEIHVVYMVACRSKSSGNGVYCIIWQGKESQAS